MPIKPRAAKPRTGTIDETIAKNSGDDSTYSRYSERLTLGAGHTELESNQVCEEVKRVVPIARFEDLIAWRKARALTNEVYRCTRKTAFAKDYGLADQVRRSARSIMSNTAEGHERTGIGEYLHALSIAKGSCAELRSDIYLALDQGYISDDEFRSLYDKVLEVGRLVQGLLVALHKAKSGASGK